MDVVHQDVESDDARVEARRDRAVRRVLWACLAVAVVPMGAALVLLEPAAGRLLGRAPAEASLIADLGRAGEADRGFLARSASGIVRALKGASEPARIAVAPPRLPSVEARVPERSFATVETRGRCGEAAEAAGEAACLEALAALRPDPDIRLRLTTPLPETVPAAAPVRIRTQAASSASEEAGWVVLEEGAFAREVGEASFVVSGSLAADDFASLRPISDVGLGGYIAGDEGELAYGVLAGAASRSFSQGRWRVRPALDLEASYLSLEKVRLDAGEAGLFVPEADDWIFAARPSVALEGELDAGLGLTMLPSFRAGATWLSQTEFAAGALMLDAPMGVAGLAGLTPMEETFADLEAGLGFAASERLQLSVRYGRLFGDAFEASTSRLELNMQF